MSSGIFVLIERGLGWNLIRSIFSSIDVVFFFLFNKILQATFDVAGLELVSETAFEQFQNRVYVILGIFMLFKVTVSMLQYLVNPDKLNDKEVGLSKMISRTIVTLCMLVAFPRVFKLLYRAQEPLLEAIPRIIIGKTADNGNVGSQMDSTANKITWTVYSVVFNQDGNEVTEFNNVEAVPEHINDPTDDNSVYKYDYLPLVGALIAAVMSFIMLGMCIDIAIRAFKLVILRMIAPIPIISYIDPKSAKDGAFNNWLKSLTSTWLDLFIKMGILYFIIYMIDLIILQGNIDFGGLTGIRKLFVIIIVIIGLLFFARQAPKFISDALGIKNSKGLGVGLGGALAAGGALLGRAGVVGALGAGASYANEAADAAAQGKAAGPAWSKGRDLAAQIRTGDKNAKGGLTNRINSRLSDQSSERRAARLGLTADNVAALKGNMYDKEKELARARDAISSYEQAVQSGEMKYDEATMRKLQENVISANTNYGKAQSAYNDAKAARESIVRKNTTADDYSRARRGSYIARLNAGNNGFERKATSVGEVAYKDLDNVDMRSLRVERNNQASNNDTTNSPHEPMTEDNNDTYMGNSSSTQGTADEQAGDMYENIFNNQRNDE